jgi:amino acid transporter
MHPEKWKIHIQIMKPAKLKKNGIQWYTALIIALVPVLLLWIIEFPSKSDFALAIMISSTYFVLFFLTSFGAAYFINNLIKHKKENTPLNNTLKIIAAIVLGLMFLLLIWYLIISSQLPYTIITKLASR